MGPSTTRATPGPTAPAEPYRGPDRRGVARFVVPARAPTLILLILAAALLAAAGSFRVTAPRTTVIELEAIAATLAVMGGIACILRWRLDGIARGWWCGWALLVIGVGQLVLQPIHSSPAVGAELAMFVLGTVLFARAIFGPEVDATIRLVTTAIVVLAGVVVATIPAVIVGDSPARARVAYGVAGAAWILVAIGATVQRVRDRHDPESGWIIPVATALGLAELLQLALRNPGAQMMADRSFELMAMGMAAVAALGGLVRAAVHHRTRALRERIEHDREIANRERVEASFADRLHELRSTVVAIEGGVATLPEAAISTTESTLRAALIAEIRRLRTLVNEAPAATGVEPFDVAEALAATVALQQSNGIAVTLVADQACTALGRADDVAQVVHGLLTNAAKYAPGAVVQVVVRHELDEIAIRVEDAGAGIDPEYWDLVFERGFRIDPAAAPGTGLGLAVARDLIRSQDGDLWVEERLGGGAAFVVSIPAAPALRVVPERAETVGDPASPAARADAPPKTMQEAR